MTSTRIPKTLAAGAVLVGVAAGSYGIASAASGSGTTANSSSSSLAPATPSTSQAPAAGTRPAGPPPGASSSKPWGNQRSDETPLTGDALAKVTAAAKAKVSGGTIVRVETDADGHAKYEAHMTDSSGNPVTVYVNAAYEVVSVEQGH